MDVTLRYGVDSSIQLQLDDGQVSAHCATPAVAEADGLATRTQQVLASPLEFPPLEKIAVPGDQVVIALDPGIPDLSQILAPVIATLLQIGVQPADITLLRAVEDMAADHDAALSLVEAAAREQIQQQTHDPSERDRNAYLATTKNDQRVYLSRLLTDADLVLPIGLLRTDELLGCAGTNSTLYPQFSDDETKQRYIRAAVDGKANDWRGEVDEVGWLLGVQFMIQVIPGAGDEVLHVLAGESRAVFEEGKRLAAEAYTSELAATADLVVATITGATYRQTWYEVGRALQAAAAAVSENGAIVVCCDLDLEHGGNLGTGLNWLASSENASSVFRRVQQQLPEDAWEVTQLSNALDKARVYLLSQLESSLVEDLNIAPIADGDELVRLISRSEDCVILENANYRRVTVG